jgi:hypothetical protein
MLAVFVFGFTGWLGLYLLARDWNKYSLRFAGLGLAAYALGLGMDVIGNYVPDTGFITIARWPLYFVPGFCWFSAAVSFLPEDTSLRENALRIVRYGLLVTIILLYVFSAAFDTLRPVLHGLIAAGVTVMSLVALFIISRKWRSPRPTNMRAVITTVSLFFLLSTGLFILPTKWIPTDIAVISIGLDMVLLGLCIAVMDAFDEGESLLPDMLRSFSTSLFAAALFGGQVTLIMALNGTTAPIIILLLTTIAAAVFTQTFADSIQGFLDGLVFNRLPHVRRARADLRAAANALPRLDQGLNLETLDEEEFARLTRRALSHLSNLERLASNPLTRLPIIERRIAARGETSSTLERAVEFKMLLTESITRLKPRDKGEFGTSDEWRYYNALYFPYVLGLKPYNSNGLYDALAPTERMVLDWFQTSVPERTLHNWQNAAARLIAQDLREQHI